MQLQKENYLKEIITTLSKEGVNFIICGGVALVLHGVERMTMDIDLSVDMSDDNLSKFLLTMKKLQLVPRVPMPPESLLIPEERKILVDKKNALVFTFIDNDCPYRQVDIFLTDELSYSSLKSDIETVDIAGCSVNVISKKRLLKMKKSVKPPRDKDIFDIQALEKLVKADKDKA